MDDNICSICNHPISIGEWPFCPHSLVNERYRISPVTYFLSPTGEIVIPPSESIPPPPGHTVHEATDLPGLRRLTARLDRQAAKEWDEKHHTISSLKTARVNQLLSRALELRSHLTDPEALQLADHGIKRYQEMLSTRPPSYPSNVYFEVAEYDSNNDRLRHPDGSRRRR